jgi:hypothetical protein
MQISVELRYAGVVIGKAEAVRASDGAVGRLFLQTADPMPVGTTLEMASGADIAVALVLRVVETGGEGKTGMDVQLVDPAAVAATAAARGTAPARAPIPDTLEAALASAAATATPIEPTPVEAPAPSPVPEAISGEFSASAPVAIPEGDELAGVSGRHTTEFGAVDDSGDPNQSNGAGGKRKRKRRR